MPMTTVALAKPLIGFARISKHMAITLSYLLSTKLALIVSIAFRVARDRKKKL